MLNYIPGILDAKSTFSSKNSLHANIINENNLNFIKVMSFLPKSFERKKNQIFFYFFLVMFCSSIFLNIAQMLYKIEKQICIFSPFWTLFLTYGMTFFKGTQLSLPSTSEKLSIGEQPVPFTCIYHPWIFLTSSKMHQFTTMKNTRVA